MVPTRAAPSLTPRRDAAVFYPADARHAPGLRDPPAPAAPRWSPPPMRRARPERRQSPARADAANGLGRQAGADPIDAQSLYDFGRGTAEGGSGAEPHPDGSPGTRRRPPASRARTQYPARPDHPAQRRSLASLQRARIQPLSRHIAKLEAALTATLAQEESLAAQAARLAQVQGVGLLTATTALALCPELGTLSRGQAASRSSASLLSTTTARPTLRVSATSPAAAAACRLRPLPWPPSERRPFQSHSPRAFYQELRARGKAARSLSPPSCASSSLLLNHLLKNPNFVLAS